MILLGLLITRFEDVGFWARFGDIATWAGAIVNVAVVALALVGDQIREWYAKPWAEVEVGAHEPFLRQSETRSPQKLLLRVTNRGRTIATDIEGYVMCVTSLPENEAVRPSFLPSLFTWWGGTSTSLPRLVPETSDYLTAVDIEARACDTVLRFEAGDWGFMKLSDGTYRVDIMIASNEGILFRGYFDFLIKPGLRGPNVGHTPEPVNAASSVGIARIVKAGGV